MNIVAHNVASKLFVAFVAVAMLFTLVTPAKAATAEELQQMINQLLAQVASLQAQVGQGGQSVASGVCPFTWTRSLSQGSTGADVMKLQQFLNADVETRVAASGVGSVGMETEYYGPATAAAVSKFQVKYRSDVLSPAGLVNPTGYFGPSSMAKANMLCASAPVVVPPTTGDDTSDDSDDTTSAGLQGEGELAVFEVDDEEDEVQEGANDEVVMAITAEAEDGDVRLDRMTFTIVGDSLEEEDPWDVFTEFSLWVDGDKVADLEADDEDNYLNEDEGEFRFSGLGIILPEDEEVEILFAVSVMGNVDGSDGDSTWTLTPTEVRYFDADDVASTEDNIDEMGDSEVFEVVEEGADDAADLESSSDNPDSATLIVEDDTSKSDEYVVHIFDIEVDEDSSDLVLDDAFVWVTVTNPTGGVDTTVDEVIADIYLTIDGEKVKGEYADEDVNDDDDTLDNTEPDHVIAATESNRVGYRFEFDGLDLESDTDYEVEVSIEFEGTDDGAAYENSGVTIETDVDGSEWEVEGLADDNVLVGTDDSELHTLATVAPVISDVDSETSQNEAKTAGTISFTFTIEADGEDDVVLSFTDVDGDIDGTADDIRFSVSPAGGTFTTALTKLSGDATVDTVGNTWTIADGDEATFALNISVAAATAAGTYYGTLETVGGVEVDETSPALQIFD